MRRLLWVLFILFVLGVGFAAAQQEDEACPALVAAALEQVDAVCSQLGRNQACYGHGAIEAESYENVSIQFSRPGDMAGLSQLSMIRTRPLTLESGEWGIALLKLQANLPDTLPGQSVLFLLMGDASLENAVAPEEARPAVEPVMTTLSATANLRAIPSSEGARIGGLDAGAEVALVGVNTAGDWYEIELEDGTSGWIWRELVTAVDTSALPVTYNENGAPLYRPMQAFTFSAGVGSAECSQVSDSMVIQSPGGFQVSLNINGLDITIGSTVILTTVFDETIGKSILVGTLVEGTFSARYEAFITTLTEPGQTFAVTLNEAGMVDENSQVVDLAGNTLVEGRIQAGCQVMVASGLLDESACEAPLQYYEPIASGGEGDLSDVGAQDPCTLLAVNNANLRSGPGTEYSWNGTLETSMRAHPDGSAAGSDGSLWWRLTTGQWVRADLLQQAGACDVIPIVEAPAPPQAGPPSGQVTIYEISGCHPDLNNLRPGQQVIFQDGIGRWATPAEKEAALAGHSAVITIDGAPLNVYYEGTTLHTGAGAPDGYGDRSRALWTATAGTHTVSGYWTSHGGTDTCVFTVQP